MIKSYYKNQRKFYEVVVYAKDSGRKQHCRKKKGISSERKANEIEFQLKKELDRLVTGRITHWTWREWHGECLNRMKLTLKKATLLNYDGRLKKWLPKAFADLPLEEIRAQDIHELLFETIADRTSLHSKKSLLKMIKRIFEMAVEEGILARNPSLSLKVKVPMTQKKVLNTQEAEKLLREACRTNHRFYEIWAFALMSGMRSGEMFALRWQDVDLETGLISINKQWTNKDGIAPPKNRECRVVPINDDLRAFLRNLKIEAKAHCQQLWDSRSKEMVTLKDLLLPRLKEWENGEQAQVLREFCGAIGVTLVRFHDLRATFITNMLAQGVPLVQVMSIVGHRKMSTTDEYLRLAGVNIKGATQKIGYKLPQKEEVRGNVVSLASFKGSRE